MSQERLSWDFFIALTLLKKLYMYGNQYDYCSLSKMCRRQERWKYHQLWIRRSLLNTDHMYWKMPLTEYFWLEKFIGQKQFIYIKGAKLYHWTHWSLKLFWTPANKYYIYERFSAALIIDGPSFSVRSWEKPDIQMITATINYDDLQYLSN
jgi:hypothetical protein